MPFIKIKGQLDPIEVTDEQGAKIRQILFDEGVAQEELIDVGRIVVQKRNIISVVFEQKEKVDMEQQERFAEWNSRQQELALLSPKERAERTAWQPFKMFYWGVHRKNPEETMREKVVSAVEQFYADHPAWTYPSMKLWYGLLNIPHNTLIDIFAFRVLERAEYRAMQDARFRIKIL